MNHIGNANKMVSDTPRTNQVSIRQQYGDEWDWCRADFARTLERELNAANDRIRLLIAERDTARLQSDQKVSLREEFRELLGTDDIEQGIAVVNKMKQRIKRLEEAGDEAICPLEYASRVRIWTKAKDAK
jgi:hypothetical protein